MKEIKPILSGIPTGAMLDLALNLKEARLHKKRIHCGYYKMSPLYATPNGFILQIPDDESEDLYLI